MAEYTQQLYERDTGLVTPIDPVSQVLAHKAMLQEAVIKFPDTDYDFGPKTPMDVGIFRVFPTEALEDWTSPLGDLQINAGETYLDFHVRKTGDVSNTTGNDGYSQIARFMESRKDITRLFGVTYRAMARNGEHYQGFRTAVIPLPPKVMESAVKYWRELLPNADPKKHFGAAYAIWYDREPFIDRFGGDL